MTNMDELEVLKKNQARYLESQRIAMIGSWELDFTTGVLWWSDETFRIFNIQPADFGEDYESFLDLVHPDDRDEVDESYRASIADQQIYDFVHRIRPDGGHVKYVHEVGRSFFDESGQVVRSAGTVQDVTARIESERHLSAVEEELRHSGRVRSVGVLAASLAHDFKNLLTPILGHCDLLLSKYAQSHDDILEHTAQIQKAAKAAEKLVREMLDFTREPEEKRGPLDINVLVGDVIEFVRPGSSTKITVETDLGEDCHCVLADESRIHQLLLNLCTNAIQSMDEAGGVLRLETREVQMDQDIRLHCPGLVDDSYLRLRVMDSGCGMPDSLIERVFEPFVTTRGEGTGLGLSIVHGIVRSHQGGITVESSEGEGSCFTLYLPVTDEKPLKESLSATGTGVESVLLLDDDEAIASVMGKMLEHLGYSVNLQNAPGDALRLLGEDTVRFDLLICEYSLRSTNMVELMTELRQIRPNLPIIFVTTNSDNIDQELLEQCSPARWLVKPISMAQLSESMRASLAG